MIPLSKTPTLLLILLTLGSQAEEKKTTQAPKGMILIPGGTYTRGNDTHLGQHAQYPEEKPVHQVQISPFYLDQHEVTNAQFKKFTDATGYKTQAERGWSPKDFPHAPAGTLHPGALIFTPPPKKTNPWQPRAETQWWIFTKGANWKHPQGPQSNIKNKMNHPVVCITWEDANAYAKWAHKRLPTEAEWERAARGGKENQIFTWGNQKPTQNQWLANIFTGTFPDNDTGTDGFIGTAPVKSYPPNHYGLYDMAGNVWEHCSDLYRPDAYTLFMKNTSKNPTGPDKKHAINQPMLITYKQTGHWPKTKPHPLTLLHTTKGGSFLCHETYCLRYRPAARHYSESLAPTNHTGFRCALSKP